MSDFADYRQYIQETGRGVVQLRTLDGRVVARDTAGKVPPEPQPPEPQPPPTSGMQFGTLCGFPVFVHPPPDGGRMTERLPTMREVVLGSLEEEIRRERKRLEQTLTRYLSERFWELFDVHLADPVDAAKDAVNRGCR